jgi:hypothetical protein
MRAYVYVRLHRQYSTIQHNRHMLLHYTVSLAVHHWHYRQYLIQLLVKIVDAMMLLLLLLPRTAELSVKQEAIVLPPRLVAVLLLLVAVLIATRRSDSNAGGIAALMIE